MMERMFGVARDQLTVSRGFGPEFQDVTAMTPAVRAARLRSASTCARSSGPSVLTGWSSTCATSNMATDLVDHLGPQEYCQIEKLVNLDQIPRQTGVKVACLPIKVKGGSGGCCRAVAFV